MNGGELLSKHKEVEDLPLSIAENPSVGSHQKKAEKGTFPFTSTTVLFAVFFTLIKDKKANSNL